MDNKEYTDIDIECTKAILNAIYGYNIRKRKKPRYNIVITLDNGIVKKYDKDPITMDEVISNLKYLTLPTTYGNHIKRFDIMQEPILR